jgi:hypothetical protein
MRGDFKEPGSIPIIALPPREGVWLRFHCCSIRFVLVIGLLKAAALRHLTRIRLQLAIYFWLLEGSLTENTASWQGERFVIEKPARIAEPPSAVKSLAAHHKK